MGICNREVNKMNKKIIGISIVLLLLAIIPSTSIATVTSTEEESGLMLLGTVIVNEIENDTVHGLAIRLRYFEWTETEQTAGMITLNKVIFPDGFFMMPIGKLNFIIGVVKGRGGLEVE